MTDHPMIYGQMAKVLAELPAIGKDDYNQQQGFHFRGIDAVLNALNPLLAKHGVFYVPDVEERIYSQRPTRNGGVMHTVDLHVRFRFYAEDGSYVEASGWGEGTDSGDKATNKAMTGAMKYVLFQVFAISTKEASDSDRESPEETVSADAFRQQQADSEARDLGWADRAEMDAAHKDFADRVKARGLVEQVKEYRTDLGYRAPYTADQLAELDKFVDGLVAAGPVVVPAERSLAGVAQARAALDGTEPFTEEGS